MLFNSYEFLLGYLPIVLVGFFALGYKNHFGLAIVWLGVASLIFYAWWNPAFVVLLLISIGFNYLLGKKLGASSEPSQRDRGVLLFGVVANLALLVYYKYAGFFVEALNGLGLADWHIAAIVLPLGISFFTFTQIAYLVDAYRKEVRDYRFSHYLLFVTFFPHLIAGPVLHHAEIMPQFGRCETFRAKEENFSVGLSIFLIGLFKKVMIADHLASFASPVFSAAQSGVELSILAAWGGALAYSFQIYFDFSGYSDMAIGLARIFGVTFPANFNSPYKATNIIEFWRRWHMTLSRFLRDYLYIPLGGGRCAPSRRYANLFLTMLLGGLWHGAGWTFVIWGALHGGFLVLNHLSISIWGNAKQPTVSSPVIHVAKVAFTFVCVVVAWVFFRAESVAAALVLLRGMIGLNGLGGVDGYFRGGPEIGILAISALIVWLAPNVQQMMSAYRPALETYAQHGISARCLRWQPHSAWAVMIAILGAVAFINITGLSEFLYFQF